MTSLRLVLIAGLFTIAGAACSQSGPQVGSGMGGSGGSGAGGTTAVTVDDLTGIANTMGDKLKDSWMMFPCYSQAQQDCITFVGACPNQDLSLPFEEQGLVMRQTFDIGGTPGKMYEVTIKVNGITEAKYYNGGTRADGDTAPVNPDVETGLNMFYTGGEPVNVENYNVYKIITQNMAGDEMEHYYLNSMPTGTGSNFEAHNTFLEGYVAKIPVMGGGKVIYHEADRNCHAVDNCGTGSRSTTCTATAGRNIPNEPNLTIPTAFLGTPMEQFNTRNANAQPFHAQAIHITVTDVALMAAP